MYVCQRACVRSWQWRSPAGCATVGRPVAGTSRPDQQVSSSRSYGSLRSGLSRVRVRAAVRYLSENRHNFNRAPGELRATRPRLEWAAGRR